MSQRRALTVWTLTVLGSLCTLSAHAQTPSRIEELSASSRLLGEQVTPAVVEIVITGLAPTSGGGQSAIFARKRGTGSGVLLAEDGYIVTNYHVVVGARRIQVALPASEGPRGSILGSRGRVVGAQVVGSDAETDLAVLKVQATGLPFLELSDSDELRQGDMVFAFGSPLGLEHSMSMGVVSSVARQLAPESPMIYVQTDAAINPGNSGGALVDSSGRLVGINTLILSQSGGNEGIGFAVPSNIVKAVYDQIRTTGRVRRGEIGIRAQTITPPLTKALGLARDHGVVISDVHPGGPGAAAGLAIGDIVVALEGKPMENARQLQVNMYRKPPGTGVKLEVLRNAVTVTVTPTVRERAGDVASIAQLVTPEVNLIPDLGVLVLEISDSRIQGLLPPLRAQAGVIVAAGSADAPFWSDPLVPGDVIYAVNRERITNIKSLKAVLGELRPGAALALQVERDRELRFISVTLSR